MHHAREAVAEASVAAAQAEVAMAVAARFAHGRPPCTPSLEQVGGADLLLMGEAAGSAPLLEAAHACHDLLERRIFQT